MTQSGTPWRSLRNTGIVLVVALGIAAAYHRTTAPRKSRLFEDNATHPAVAPISGAVAGRQLFIQHCSVCHQLNGQGIPNAFPPLAGSEWVNGSDDRIIRIVLNGLAGPIKVEGSVFNTIMPPFNSLLKDEEIAHILTYVRQEWGNYGRAVTREKVAGIRMATAERTVAWTAEELLKIP